MAEAAERQQQQQQLLQQQEEEEESDADDLLVIPGLDGSLFVVSDDGEAHPLSDHTVQDLVAQPTIFADGVLIGSK